MNGIQALQVRDTYNQNNTANKIQDIGDTKEFKREQLQEVAENFEQIFINMIFNSMRKTLDKESDILHGGFSQEIFEDMLYEKYSEEIASTNFMGLGEQLISQYEKYI